MMIDPIVWMRAACIALSEEKAAELEMTWERPTEDEGQSERRQNVVRREVQHNNLEAIVEGDGD
jgi:hypothetical protein